MSKEIHAIIPARYESSRFPGKALAEIEGKPMFWHVWSRAKRCELIHSVSLATDDERIARAAENLGVDFLMTAKTHKSGTDRVYEAAQLMGLAPDSIILNIQGDEPALSPKCLYEIISCFNDPSVRAATLAYEITEEEVKSTDIVKVVRSRSGDALYFSRAGIPFDRDKGLSSTKALGHMGLYAYSFDTLKAFVSFPNSELEDCEKLEQLRLLDNGIPIRVAITRHRSPGVDRPEDLEKIILMLKAGKV